jgi:cytochrome b
MLHYHLPIGDQKMPLHANDSGTETHQPKKGLHRVAVWDAPTRIFHWSLVILVALSFTTGMMGGVMMLYHERSGVAILVLIGFRLIWGFIGGAHARFVGFVQGPRAVAAYMSGLFRSDSKPYLGHNPLGGWSILAMLGALSLQVGTGLFSNDDILTEGPLFRWVSKETSDLLTQVHLVNQNIVIGLISIHIVAVGFYLIKKHENLVLPMITGYKQWHETVDTSQGSVVKGAVLLVVLAVAAYIFLYR